MITQINTKKDIIQLVIIWSLVVILVITLTVMFSTYIDYKISI